MANLQTRYFTLENHNRQIAGKKVEKTRLISPLGEIFIDEVGKFSGSLKNKKTRGQQVAHSTLAAAVKKRKCLITSVLFQAA